MANYDEPTEIAEIKLRRMLALSETLQNGRSAEDTLATVRTGNISYHLDNNTLDRPWAMVQQSDQQLTTQVGVGAHIAQGTLWVGFQRDVPDALKTDTGEIDQEMSRWFGKVMSEVLEQSDQDDPLVDDVDDIYAFIHIRDVRRLWFGEVDPAKRATLGFYYFATYEVDWGFEP